MFAFSENGKEDPTCHCILCEATNGETCEIFDLVILYHVLGHCQ